MTGFELKAALLSLALVAGSLGLITAVYRLNHTPKEGER